jgi:hypothetical protein
VAPPDEVDPLVLVLRACADHMSVALPEPVPSVLASVQLQHGDLRPLVTLQVCVCACYTMATYLRAPVTLHYHQWSMLCAVPLATEL